MLNNRYLIRSTLGRGGFGQTYLVEDTHSPSRRLRVVKQLKPQAGDSDLFPLIRDRFEREAAILERLGDAHDQIPTLHAYFSEAGEFYLVQDWVEGRSLGQKVREEGTLGETEAREFLLDILPVLDFVHSQNVIHRDINPNNIMIRAHDVRPVLIDFGAVKEVVTTVVDSHGHPSSTIAIGSPGYMPLEQYAGRPVFASDIFSLGLTVLFSLTGKHPKEMHDLRTGEISWRGYAPGLSDHLAGVLTKAVAYHAHDRFPGAREMLAALQVDEFPPATDESSPKVSRPGRGPGGELPTEATTQLSEETILRRSGEPEEQTLVSNDRSKAIEFIGNNEIASVEEPVVAININQQYPQSKNAEELYHATRGIWRLNRQRAQRAQYAFAVYQGEVKEVYRIDRWMPATRETTEYWDKRSASQGKHFPSEVNEGRSEFVGEVAPEPIRKKYVGKKLPVRHSQNPIRYLNC